MKQLFTICLCILITSLLTNCTREEGCLDAKAKNFDPGVDKNCCCEFPAMAVKTFASAGSIPFNKTDTYYDAIATKYNILDIQFYLSQFSLVTNGGYRGEINNKLSFTSVNGTAEKVTDSYLLISPDLELFNAGEYRDPGDFDKVQFYFGVDEIANSADPDSMPADHALSNQVVPMYDSLKKYLFFRAEIHVDREPTSRIIEIYGNNNLQLVDVIYDITAKQAFDATINLNVDYKAFFEGVKFLEDDSATIEQKILNNLNLVFSKQN